jgi:capsular exopolysaccharide synthesis family protein
MGKIDINIPEMPYAVEEALNRLRINVKFCGNNIKKIMVVSSVPNEGKSFVSMHLWRMLAEAGLKSVLVDADLRNSVLKSRHDFQSAEKELHGLDFYLSGLSDYRDVIYQTNIENGDIVPTSNLLENPSTLLEDPRFQQMLDGLAEEYRYVIVDVPPLGLVADGALIASMCDGAILVVNSGEVSRKLVKQSVDQIEQSNCKLLGMVLNKADIAGHAYGKYGQYKYYGKYYGNQNKTDTGA